MDKTSNILAAALITGWSVREVARVAVIAQSALSGRAALLNEREQHHWILFERHHVWLGAVPHADAIQRAKADVAEQLAQCVANIYNDPTLRMDHAFRGRIYAHWQMWAVTERREAFVPAPLLARNPSTWSF